MYRIAIISDVQGNIHALNAVLKDINNKSVDYIYCLGDMIGIGPFSNEVLDKLFETNNLEMITGNHDEAVLAILNNEPYPKSRANVIPHHEWIAERLNSNHKLSLEKLTRIINPIIYGKTIHLIHYPMRKNSQIAPICDDPFDLTGMPSPDNFSLLDGLDDISLVCFGHDHSTHQFICDNKMFYNTGSLGCSNKAYARYGIVDIDEKGFNIIQQYVPYALDIYINELRKTAMPRKEIILGIFL